MGKIMIPRTYDIQLRSHIVKFNVPSNFDVQRGVSRGLKCICTFCKAPKIVTKQNTYYFFIDFPCLYLNNRNDSTLTLESLEFRMAKFSAPDFMLGILIACTNTNTNTCCSAEELNFFRALGTGGWGKGAIASPHATDLGRTKNKACFFDISVISFAPLSQITFLRPCSSVLMWNLCI